jgi:CBS domain-containing protein
MTPSPICVTNNDTVAKAKSLMVRRNVDQIPILKRNKLGGVITSSVIVFNTLPQIDRGRKGGWRGGKHQGSRLDVPVEDFAEPDVTSNDVKETPREVFETMERNRTNYSVIVNYDEVQGIVTYRDFMRPLVEPERKSGEDAVPMYIVGLPEDPFEAEAAKSKFTRVAQLFNKAVPKVEEIRAVIKKGKTKAARKRYEVRVFVKSPLRQYNFEAFGFELPDVFDQVDSWAKGVIGRSDTSFRRRARADPGELR